MVGVSLTLMDQVSGPFQLEMKDISLEDYIANLRINANSDRPDPADRGYYEPAPGRHWYAGASYAW